MKLHLPVMNVLKKLPIFVLTLLLFTGCKKRKFETSGTLELIFKNGIPSCYYIYTEISSSKPLHSYPTGPKAAVNVKNNGNTLIIEGLNYGTYIFSACSLSDRVVQVAAGATKTYEF